MIDDRLVRVSLKFEPSPDAFERLSRRRDRKRRNKRITAGVVGIGVFVATVWLVASGGPLDRTQTPVVPGDPSAVQPSPPSAVGPVPETDYMLDLDTGEMTPLPTRIVGTKDLTGNYAVSPDGSTLAYVAPDDNGNPQIFVANLDGTRASQVTNGRGASWPAWSPDGSTIAYIAGDEAGEIIVLDLATGESTQVMYEPREGLANAPSFSPDGSSIVYTYRPRPFNGDEIRIVPIAGGKSMRLVGGHGVDADSGSLSPDGSLLSYACAIPKDISDLCLANADGTEARTLASGNIPIAGSWSPDGTRIAYGEFWGLGVSVVDVATGEATRVVAEATSPRWLDDHTLIVDHDYCNQPHDDCPG